MFCADTNFLSSLYGNDRHTEEALAILAKASQPLLLSARNVYELGHARRFAESRGLLSSGVTDERLQACEEDRSAGPGHLSEIALTEVLAEANRISAAHTLTSKTILA